ncbi:MAG: response regulator [Alphaproteobacteria bacterium]|jgi:DNA-binding response OmpR family regulator|nr:response regulator [Alphaproteobacteria bacterium]
MASSQNNQDVRIVLFDHDSDVRQNLKSSLAQDSFTQTMATAGLKTAQAALYNNEADLFIVDIDKEKDTVLNLMRKIRDHEIGDNPFPVSVALSSDPDHENVRQTINSGFDLMLLKPFSMTTFLGRINHLARHRAEFAVTSDYIGPDRRMGNRDNPNQARFPMTIVPNPVKIIANGEMTREAMKLVIQKGVTTINERRVSANGHLITDLIEKLASKHLLNEMDDKFLLYTRKLDSLSIDMNKRLKRSKFAHIGELCESVGDVVQRMLETPLQPLSKDIELLQNLGRAIDRAFETGDSEAGVVHQISDSFRAIA